FFSRSVLPSSQEKEITSNELPQDTQRMQAGVASLPVSNKKGNEVSEMTEKLVCMTFDDEFGSKVIEPAKEAIDRLVARWLIRSSGSVGFLNPVTPCPGLGIDVSPRQRRGKLREQFAVMAENSIQVHDPVSTLPAPMLHLLDCFHADAATAMLEPLSQRVPGASHLVITACADSDLK